ncbi:MAG: hypothetical protein WDO69_29300 [Pseudomonadota bacterium]
MLPLLFAQLVTLSLGDRTEARYLAGDNDNHYEASTRPTVGLTFGWKRGSLAVVYGPFMRLSPLESTPRSFDVFHFGSAIGTYRFRLTTVSISETGGYGYVNLREVAVAPPGATAPIPNTPTPGAPTPTMPTTPANPGGIPGTGGTNTGSQAPSQLRTIDRSILFGASTTNLALQHTLSRRWSLGEQVGYSVAGGVGYPANQIYPWAQGWLLGVTTTYLYTFSRPDSLSSALSLRWATGSDGNQVYTFMVNEYWTHEFNARTRSVLGAGITASRFSNSDGLVGYSIYPTALASIGHFRKIGAGTLSLFCGVYSTPVIDPLRATVDPRLGVSGGITFSQGKFTSNASASAAVSVAPTDDQGAVDSVGAGAGAGYWFGKAFSMDSGIRAAWQTYQGNTVTPASWTAYVAATFVAETLLNGHR